jgi:pimeloyl-ACP methyl ester carboxylesterase
MADPLALAVRQDSAGREQAVPPVPGGEATPSYAGLPEVDLLAAESDRRPRRADVAAAKAELFEYCRDEGYSLPIAAVWGADDPTSTLAHGHELLRFLSTGTASVTFHAMNRTGHFPFSEDPGALTRILLPTLTAQG